jgi:ornithine cyclodeaminase/alanine dehydrogenase-like protein (mu-crystallin family)
VRPPYLDAETIARRLPPADAVDALEAALRGGLDVDADPPRTSVAAGGGELLLMPSAAGGGLGVKLVTVAPRGEPRIKGVFVLFDGETLAPVALLDGIGLTNVRTSAVTALAVRHLAPDARRLVVFGTGPQARAHVAALRAVAPLEHVGVVGRDPERTAAFARDTGAEPVSSVAGADLVCCATTAREPLFGADDIAGHATVVAIGSHEPDAREVDERLVARATVVVESRPVALREAGDIVMAVAAGAVAEGDLHDLGALVRGEVRFRTDRPRLFKSTGMAWEDLVIARAAHDRA